MGAQLYGETIIYPISVMELGHLLTRSVSSIQKSLQRSAMIPSASWEIAFHYPGVNDLNLILLTWRKW